MLLLALALVGQPSPPIAPIFGNVGRVYTSPALHVGVRGAALASPLESGLALTLQLTL